MSTGLKGIAKKMLGPQLTRSLSDAYRRQFSDYSSKTWSQNGEDVLIDAYFNKSNGYYVEIGAHHPRRYSNTYRLYQRGWSGLAIDPLPGLAEHFRRERPRDVFLNVGVGIRSESLTFFEFEDPAVSTFLRTQADAVVAGGHRLRREIKIELQPIAEILAQNVRRPIDFVSMDVEGMDEAIIEAWPFAMFRPRMFVVELLTYGDVPSRIPELLRAEGYEPYSRSGWSHLYTLQNFAAHQRRQDLNFEQGGFTTAGFAQENE